MQICCALGCFSFVERSSVPIVTRMNGAVWARTNRLTWSQSVGIRLRRMLVLHLRVVHASHVFMGHTFVPPCGCRSLGLTRSHSRLEMRAERGDQKVASLAEQQSSCQDSGC
jgi:hypothetical protein